MFGLRLMFDFFRFYSIFFCFFWSWLWKTKKFKVFFFVFWINWWLKTCENSGLFCFFAWIVCTCLLKICSKTKKICFFGFFALLRLRVPSKNKKPWVLIVFWRSRPKKTKNSRKTKKKQTWASDQTFSEKFCFFGFLVFSRFFWFWFWFGGL